MLFDQLPQDIQDKLNAGGMYLVRYSSNIDDADGTVDDAIKIDVGADSLKQELLLKSYATGSATEYFEFCTKGITDEEALRFANEALIS